MKQLALIHQRRVHIAVMRQSWGLLEKIISGQKTVEMRWYKARFAPWDAIEADDEIYFKNAGQPVTVRAEVEKVIQFGHITPARVKEILDRYGERDGLSQAELQKFVKEFAARRYCIVIFLKNPRSIKPFEINKSGFGHQTAWLVLDNIEKVKVQRTHISQPKLLGR